MALVIPGTPERGVALPYAGDQFYPPGGEYYPPMLNGASMPIIPTVAAANPGKLLQPVIRTVGKHGHMTAHTRTPEEIALRNSIDQMLPHLDEKNAETIRSELDRAEHHKTGKQKGHERPIDIVNLVKISMHARELLAHQIRVQAGYAERHNRSAKRKLRKSKAGAYDDDGNKIKAKGAIIKAYGRAKRARIRRMTNELLQGDELEGDAALGAERIKMAVSKRFLKKVRKESSLGPALAESVAETAATQRTNAANDGERAPSQRRPKKKKAAAAPAAQAAAEVQNMIEL